MKVIDINCDMSEGFGTWTFGSELDEHMIRGVSSINVAAGFHAGDPNLIAATMRLARDHEVGVGVHPGFGDLAGFGRRHIQASPEELVNDSVYQLGAVRELARVEGLSLRHFKLHGALYMHAADDDDFAQALVQTLHRIEPEMPILLMPDTAIHRACQEQGHPCVREFYADRHYGDDGQIVFTRGVGRLAPDDVAAKVVRACTEGVVTTVSGADVPVEFESICLHSDTPGAMELLDAITAALGAAGITISAFAA